MNSFVLHVVTNTNPLSSPFQKWEKNSLLNTNPLSSPLHLHSRKSTPTQNTCNLKQLFKVYLELEFEGSPVFEWKVDIAFSLRDVCPGAARVSNLEASSKHLRHCSKLNKNDDQLISQSKCFSETPATTSVDVVFFVDHHVRKQTKWRGPPVPSKATHLNAKRICHQRRMERLFWLRTASIKSWQNQAETGDTRSLGFTWY